MQVNDRIKEEMARAVREAENRLAARIIAEHPVHAVADASPDAAVRAVERLRAERDALRAIIEGRTTPPTAVEIEAHHAAGGAWLLRWPWREGMWACAVCWRGVRDEWMPGAVCIALDAQRRPCPWPEVAR